ncbi:MAG: BamA/TamA family outer membrane protein [Deferribacteres bacterium]|nr:BamA/TamA family outer membrane protein [candidate division KSB1 bacterium]MCB9500372.1 BamA/TamA family outer membrane protein [Deferribacteres bacterium]
MPDLWTKFIVRVRSSSGTVAIVSTLMLLFVVSEVDGSNKLLEMAEGDSTQYPLEVRFQDGRNDAPLLQALGLNIRNPVTNLQLSELAQRSLNWLNSDGYYFASIDTLEKRQQPKPHIFLCINAGVKSKNLHISIKPSNNVYQQQWQKSIAHTNSIAGIKDGIFTILEELSEHGYPFAKIIFDSVTVEKNNTDFGDIKSSSHVLFGPYVVLDTIEIRGNSLTQDKVIRRETGIKIGDVYKASRVREVRDRLQRMGIFSTVGEPQLFYENGRSVLQIAVREGSTNIFNGVAGYNPGNDGESGYLTGTLDLQFGNLLGTGRKMAARWEKRNRHAQELAIHYFEPWFLNYPVHLQGGFQQLIQDTLYVERRFDFAVEWPFRDIVNFVGKLERTTVNPDSFGIELFNLQKSSSFSAGFGLRYDSRNNTYNPQRGVYYYTIVESVQKQANGHFKQQKVAVDFHWLLPLWRLQVFSSELHWRDISSTEERITFADQYRLGGAKTLRGYREEQFRGDRLAWANLEYRYLLGRSSRAFLFFDAGSISADNENTGNEIFTSFGLGVRMETKLGIVGLDFGLGKGDGLSQGKIHVSLVNSF